MKLAILLVTLAFSTVAAQNRSKTFEVSSVKRAEQNRFVPPTVSAQRFRIVATLKDAILWAYDIRGYQISGGSPWVSREYYQIEGTTSSPATIYDMRTMVQGLLAERFKLKVHRERKEMPVYTLSKGAGVDRLQLSTTPCNVDGCIDVAPGKLKAKSARMPSIAETLSNMGDRPVLDQTGLDGRYDIEMTFDPTFQNRYEGQPAPVRNPEDPTIFAAIQDLGLRMEPRRATVEILVVDSAATPTSN